MVMLGRLSGLPFSFYNEAKDACALKQDSEAAAASRKKDNERTARDN